MQYLFILFLLLFSACGGGDTQETPPKSDYYLSYNSASTAISGEITFDMGNIPNNHTITLTNFTPLVEGCDVDLAESSVSPVSLSFNTLNTKQSATLNVTLGSACTQEKLILRADYKDTSLLSGKLVTNTKEMRYVYTITKAQTLSNYTPVLRNNRLTITQNKQNETVTIAVYDQLNRPAQEGTISIIYPDNVLEGIDSGSFEQSSVEVKDGVAQFSYTAPNNLQNLLENNVTGTSFKFYYNEDVSNFVELYIDFTPDTNQTIIKEYQLVFAPQDNSYKLSLEQLKSFSVAVTDKDGESVAAQKVRELNVSLQNSYIAELINSSGEHNKSFAFSGMNNVTLTLASKTVSGLVPIHVDVTFEDINGDMKSLSETYDIIVESGPPTAISISYAGTSQDRDRAKFIEHFAVSVTDKYFNPVNTKPQVSVGAIVGYAKYVDDATPVNTDKRVYFEANSSFEANLTSTKLEFFGVNFEANSTIDPLNDILVTFGNGYTYPASGGWNIESYTSNTLFLSEGQYDGNDTANLGFAIGRNYRQDACSFGDEWVGQAKLQNGASNIDETGTAIIDLSYDYYLVGKDIVLYINIIGYDNRLQRAMRIGEAKTHTLRGHGLVLDGDGLLSVPANTSASAAFGVWIKDTSEPYRNARFAFAKIDATGEGCVKNVTLLDGNDCQNNGRARVLINVTAGSEDCSISVSEPYILREF